MCERFVVVAKEGEKDKRQENGADKLMASEPGHNMIGKTAPKICEFSGERRRGVNHDRAEPGPGVLSPGPGVKRSICRARSLKAAGPPALVNRITL